MWWNELKDDVYVKITPKTYPITIFFDDSIHHFKYNETNILGIYIFSGVNLKKLTCAMPVLSVQAENYWIRNSMCQTYDNHCGIPEDTFVKLCNLVPLNKKMIRNIVLDWDKTLTVHCAFNTEMGKGAAECYVGGMQRMNCIQNFFKMLRCNRIPVYIVTSNPRALTDQYAFKYVLKQLACPNAKIFYSKNKIDFMKSIGLVYQ